MSFDWIKFFRLKLERQKPYLEYNEKPDWINGATMNGDVIEYGKDYTLKIGGDHTYYDLKKEYDPTKGLVFMVSVDVDKAGLGLKANNK
jgi:hypothetical protein